MGDLKSESGVMRIMLWNTSREGSLTPLFPPQ
jgi:hypothetical protein